MEKRLQNFLRAENITQSQFAEKIGVAKASVSHILAGRNKPGYEFIVGMARCYPNLNIDWLITGNGKMYKISGGDTAASENAILTASQKAQNAAEPAGNEADTLFHEEQNDDGRTAAETQEPAEKPENAPRISKILVFYDNGTFKEIL